LFARAASSVSFNVYTYKYDGIESHNIIVQALEGTGKEMRSVLTATQNGEFIIFYDLYDTLYFTECARVSHLMRLMGNFIR